MHSLTILEVSVNTLFLPTTIVMITNLSPYYSILLVFILSSIAIVFSLYLSGVVSLHTSIKISSVTVPQPFSFRPVKIAVRGKCLKSQGV